MVMFALWRDLRRLRRKTVSELDVQTDDTRSKQPLFMVFTLCCMLWMIL
jgi:hypothetical protein